MNPSEIEIEVKTLTKWAEKDPFSEYKGSPFRVSAFRTIPLLKAELAHLNAFNITLYTMHRAQDVRKIDGWPRSDRPPSHPGVILELHKPTSNGHPTKLRFPCHTFSTWEDNLRAIALALEALRKVDRYGVTTGAQYAGYKALPPGAQAPEPEQTPEDAAAFIGRSADLNITASQILSDLTVAEFCYKTAAKKLHPDKGGSAEEFAKLEKAMSMIREHFKEAQQ